MGSRIQDLGAVSKSTRLRRKAAQQAHPPEKPRCRKRKAQTQQPSSKNLQGLGWFRGVAKAPATKSQNPHPVGRTSTGAVKAVEILAGTLGNVAQAQVTVYMYIWWVSHPAIDQQIRQTRLNAV